MTELSYPSWKPSKQFIKRGTIATGALIIILIVQTHWFHSLFTKKSASIVAKEETVGDIITQDSNGNTIPDWEEKLWGLDPTVLYTNGTSNKEIIDAKRKALGYDENDTSGNETDALARQLFILTSALGQSDKVDNGTLQDIANKLGASIDIKSIGNRYSYTDIRTVKTTGVSLATYYRTTKKVFAKYDENAPDIDVLINGFETGDFSRLPELAATATTYQKLAKDILALPVPVGIAEQHLDIINSFNGIAGSFKYLMQIQEDGVQGVAGIAIYKTYSAKLGEAVSSMHDYLVQYGILNE